MRYTSAKAVWAQFFDRDFSPEIASVGMEGFQEFMLVPDNLDDILERLEETRQRILRITRKRRVLPHRGDATHRLNPFASPPTAGFRMC